MLRRPTRGAAPSRLWNIDFVLLWQGQLVSQLGTQAAFVATMLWTLEATGSPGMIALLMFASSVPAVVFGPVAGAVVDRHQRKRLLVSADLARGVMALVVGTAVLLAPSDAAFVVSLMLASALVSGIANALFGPAVKAALPDLVPPHRLAAGNSLTTMGGQASSLAGLALGGTLYAAVGPAVLLLADGVSFLFSAATESLIRLPASGRRERAPGLRTVLASYGTDTVAGLRYCLADRGRRGFMILAAGLNFLFMPVFVLLPAYVERVLEASQTWYGFLLAGLAGGSLIGLLAAASVGGRPGVRGSALAFSLVGTGVAMAVLGTATRPALALMIMVAIGALTGMVNVLVITLMQIRTPPQLRGRALATLIAFTGAATPLGLLAGGALGELAGANPQAVIVMAGAGAVVLSAAVLSRRTVREFLGGAERVRPV
jgi:MFS family permease